MCCEAEWACGCGCGVSFLRCGAPPWALCKAPRGSVFLFETVHDAAAVGGRAEVRERLRGAGGATAVEREARGPAVALYRLLCRAAHGLRPAPLAV